LFWFNEEYVMFPKRPFIAVLIFLAMGFVLPTLALSADARPVCGLCGQPITGQYMVYSQDGRKLVVCAKCERSSQRCSQCRIPLGRGEGRMVAGQLLCRSCARNAKTCSICNRLLTGRYLVYNVDDGQMLVCEQCDHDAPHCAACKRPMRPREIMRSGSKILCPSCHQQLSTCKACGEKIVGDRYFIRFQEGEFCETCWLTHPACSICGAPVGNTYSQLAGGRVLCADCAKTAVLDNEKARQILAGVRAVLEPRFGKRLDHPVELRLATPGELGLAGSDIPSPTGSQSGNTRAGATTAAAAAQASPAVPASAPDPAPPAATGVAAEGGAPAPPQIPSAGANFGPMTAGGSSGGGGSSNASPYETKTREVSRGLQEKELGKFVRHGDKFEILILSGMPESWCWETVAHEFAHAWQSEKNPDLTDIRWSEGFAQWAAMLVLEKRGDKNLLARLRGRTDLYGEAFQLVSRLETMRGRDAVVPYILLLKTGD